jgi:hypothetical protein
LGEHFTVGVHSGEPVYVGGLLRRVCDVKVQAYRARIRKHTDQVVGLACSTKEKKRPKGSYAGLQISPPLVD